MANKSKSLGTALENRVVKKAQERGLTAKRQPLSGVLKEFPSDVVVENTLLECKVRGDGTEGAEKSVRVEYAWLDKVRKLAQTNGNDLGAVVFNPKGGRTPMVLLDLDDLFYLLALTRKSVT